MEEAVDESKGAEDDSVPTQHVNGDDMDVDDEDEEDYSSDEDDPADVAMVPMADVLNAQYKSENVSYL